MQLVRRLSFLLIPLSMIVGIPVKGAYFSLFTFEFVSMPYFIAGNKASLLQMAIWTVLLLSHAGICIIPFLKRDMPLKRLGFWLPLVFIVCYTALSGWYALLLIPFGIVWLFLIFKLYSTGRVT